MKIDWVATPYNIHGYDVATDRLALRLRTDSTRPDSGAVIEEAHIHANVLQGARFRSAEAAKTYCERVLHTSFW